MNDEDYAVAMTISLRCIFSLYANELAVRDLVQDFHSIFKKYLGKYQWNQFHRDWLRNSIENSDWKALAISNCGRKKQSAALGRQTTAAAFTEFMWQTTEQGKFFEQFYTRKIKRQCESLLVAVEYAYSEMMFTSQTRCCF